MIVEPFGGEIRDGKIWGRGASDTKGPMAAMLWSLHEHRDVLAELPVAVDFVAFMGEESGQWGSKNFAKRHGKDYTFALVGEPTWMQVVHVTKGSLWATLRATGKAAHSSQPERGENAILKLARALDQLDHHLGGQLATFTHPVLGRSTMNIGMIRGGCPAEHRARSRRGGNRHPHHSGARGSGRRAQAAHRDTRVPRSPGRYRQSARKPADGNRGGPPDDPRTARHRPRHRPAGAPWFSDAAHLSSGGVPSICIGPGSIDQAHTVDEFIEITALEAGAKFFSSFISRLNR